LLDVCPRGYKLQLQCATLRERGTPCHMATAGSGVHDGNAVLTVGEEASARDAAGACVQQLRAIVEAAPGVRAVAVMLHRAGHASVHVDVYAAPDGGPRRMA
jgi:hypothetical protein